MRNISQVTGRHTVCVHYLECRLSVVAKTEAWIFKRQCIHKACSVTVVSGRGKRAFVKTEKISQILVRDFISIVNVSEVALLADLHHIVCIIGSQLESLIFFVIKDIDNYHSLQKSEPYGSIDIITHKKNNATG